MTGWINLTNFSCTVGGLMIAILCLILTLSIPYLEKWHRKFFFVFFILLIAYTASALVSLISLYLLEPDYWHLSKAAIFLESLFSSILMPFLTFYLLKCAGEAKKRSPVLIAESALWAVYTVLLIITQFTTFIYEVTPDNIYRRGPYYAILLVPPVLMMLLNLLILILKRKQLSSRQRIAFTIYLLIPLLCMLVQMFLYGLLMITIGTSVSALFMFVFIQYDQVEHHIAQREENIRQRNSIMVLQMRPHFIYNTMMSAYYLCEKDAQKAQQVILDFTTYLRKSFTAISRSDTIPFTEELEHTRAYLAVEQVRFEDNLFVEFNTPVTLFRLPPLTLQPIVENAVKHGVGPELEPLHVSVATRETPDHFEIQVSDTGPGFEPADDKEPHIALANIQERLEITCNGKLEIRDREGGGTIVTIRLPKT